MTIKKTGNWLLFIIIGSVVLSCAPTKRAAYFRRSIEVSDINVPDKDITIIYATHGIFVIAVGSDAFIQDFNKFVNEYFSFDK